MHCNQNTNKNMEKERDREKVIKCFNFGILRKLESNRKNQYKRVLYQLIYID